MTQITPYPIWIGHAGDGRAFRELFDLGIRAVVQLAAEEPSIQTPRDLVSFRFPLIDGSGNDPDLLDLAIRSVVALEQKGIPTLVCCGAGMSRSPAIVAAALALARRSGLDESMQIVAKCHPLDLSPPLWAEVCGATERAR
jgi:protein-tyrosine phosphatase